jgi:hypothetical protein
MEFAANLGAKKFGTASSLLKLKQPKTRSKCSQPRPCNEQQCKFTRISMRSVEIAKENRTSLLKGLHTLAIVDRSCKLVKSWKISTSKESWIVAR